MKNIFLIWSGFVAIEIGIVLIAYTFTGTFNPYLYTLWFKVAFCIVTGVNALIAAAEFNDAIEE